MISNEHLIDPFSQSKNEPPSSFFDLSFLSPAKINLFFRVLYKRLDGFHEIASLYQAISLYDELYFKKSDRMIFTCSDAILAADPSNLCVKAWELFKMKTGVRGNVHIHLKKNIPTQAGLGCGSSNAATTLWGLCKLFDFHIDNMTLASWGQQLGSDVPFFFSCGTAYCTGRGEKLQNVKLSQNPSPITIVKPHQGISTPLVYKNCVPESFPSNDPATSLTSFLQGNGTYYNDLEYPTFDLIPSLFELKKYLESFDFEHVVMSGSGTSFFCIGDKLLPSSSKYFSKSVTIAERSLTHWYE